MATDANLEELKRKLAWLQDALDKRDSKNERLESILEETEKNLEMVLQDNDRLMKILEESEIDLKCYDELIFDRSVLQEAMEHYQEIAEEAKTKAEKLEADGEDMRKQYENTKTINQFYRQQLAILNRDQQKNALTAAMKESPPPPPSSSGSSSTSMNLSDVFFQKTTTHVAMVQAVISQFCGAYGLPLSSNLDTAIPLESQKPDCDEKEVQTSVSWARLKKVAAEKTEKIATLKTKLAKKRKEVEELEEETKDMDRLQEKCKRQRNRIADLLKKVQCLKGDKEDLKKENETLRRRLEEEDEENGTTKNGRLPNMEKVENGGTFSSATKRSASEASLQEEPDGKLFGIKFKLGKTGRVEPTKDLLFSP